MEDEMTQRNPTILDVAKQADVAVGTVSRFLNGQNIREANRARIEAAISDLGYRTNVLARAMKTERTKSIGLLVPVFDEFNSAILTMLVDALQPQGYSLLTFHHGHDPQAMEEALTAAAARRIDALILSGTDSIADAACMQIGRGLPITLFNNNLPDVPADRVLVDDRFATAQAIGRMIEFGHKRIGFVAGDLFEATAQNRLNGYLDALSAAGLEVDQDLIWKQDWSRSNGHAATSSLCQSNEPPTAIFYSSYVLATGALDYMRSAQLVPGRHLDIVSFDDPDVFSLTTPGITAVAQPVQAVARALADLTISRLEGAPETTRTVTLGCDLVLRGSLGSRERLIGL
jgi:LacI family transcriptional regulator